MDQLVAHQRAQDLFASVLADLTPDQLQLPSPCSDWNTKEVVEHVIGGNQWVQELAGLQPGALPDDLRAAHAATAASAQAVFGAPDGLTREFELPFAKMPGTDFIGLRTGDVLTHAWDLARATGKSTDLDPELAVEVLAATRSRLSPEFRGPGRPFGEQRPCPADRPPADELAAFLGRSVD
jgi:uncharacterized protein (TIGR03086 family)